MNASRQDEIWNRACREAGGPAPAAGDTALASVLHAHGLVMNGGVVHAMSGLSQTELAAAVSGFTYFGLSAAARAFAQIPDDSEATEGRLNQMYFQAIPNDGVLVRAFRVKLVACPDAFAPISGGAHV